jgi:SAM-dependent methyltransferase
MSAAVTPDKIMQITTGSWATAILGASMRHKITTLLEDGPETAAGIARKAGLSERGAQALLDGLTGFGLLTRDNGRYANSPEASTFLVEGKPSYLGGMADVFLSEFPKYQRLPESAQTGTPATKDTTDVPDNAFWHKLVPAIAALAYPVAQFAAQRLGIAAKGPMAMLDIGGGSGVWSAVWLGMNKAATATQLDWPQVNAIGRAYVAKFGVGDRFQTIDGDFHTADLGRAAYDCVIYSNIAHQESPAENGAVFKRVRACLKPGGSLVISDFVLDAERRGHPFAMMFSTEMLLSTKAGAAFTAPDYRRWLSDAGFTATEFVPTPGPSTLIFAS